MTFTPDEFAALEAEHGDTAMVYAGFCHKCHGLWPCPTSRLIAAYKESQEALYGCAVIRADGPCWCEWTVDGGGTEHAAYCMTAKAALREPTEAAPMAKKACGCDIDMVWCLHSRKSTEAVDA